VRLPSSRNMLKIMSTIGRNARIQAFAKVVDSFVDRCLFVASHHRWLLL